MEKKSDFTETIAAQALREGGATVAWSDQKIVDNDDAWFFPAHPDDTTIVTEDDLQKALSVFVERHAIKLSEKGRYLGVWRDPTTDKFHIDVNARIEDKDEAIEKAKRISTASSYKIKAIFNLKREKTIEIDA